MPPTTHVKWNLRSKASRINRGSRRMLTVACPHHIRTYVRIARYPLPMASQENSRIASVRTHVRRLATAVVRARVLLSSYAALNLILFARLEPTAPKLVCLSLAVIGVADGLRLSWLARGKQAVPRTVEDASDVGPEVAAYLATYLLPLLAAPSPTGGDLVGYAIYGVVVVVVSLRSNMAHVNPTLYLLGWRVTSVTLDGGDRHYLISRHAPISGDQIRVSRLYGVLHEQ